MSGAIFPFPNTPSWRGAQLKIKHRDSSAYFTFTPTGNRAPVVQPVAQAFILTELTQEIEPHSGHPNARKNEL